jgi:hypothetical protein
MKTRFLTGTNWNLARVAKRNLADSGNLSKVLPKPWFDADRIDYTMDRLDSEPVGL